MNIKKKYLISSQQFKKVFSFFQSFTAFQYYVL